VPEPSWALTDYISTCKTDSSTAGALLVGVVATAGGGADRFVYRRSTIQLAGNAIYVECATPDKGGGSDTTKPPADTAILYSGECITRAVRQSSTFDISQATLKERCTPTTLAPSPTPSPDKGVPKISWASRVWYSADTVRTATLLPVLTLILAGASVYETFRPSSTSQTVTTKIYPTATPIPPRGELSSIVTTSQNVTNPGATLGTIATGLYAQALSYTNSATAILDNDEQGWRTAEGVVSGIMGDMNCWRLAYDRNYNYYPKFDDTSYPPHRPRPGHLPDYAPFCRPETRSAR
jgi:hypothetical protein